MNTPKVHYHVFMGVAGASPMATTTIEDYDESIRKFLRLSRQVFKNYEFLQVGLDYQNLLKISNFGEGGPMTVGTSGLCTQWFPCPEKCLSPNWN